MLAQMFVQFKEDAVIPEGFKKGISYPVFAIDPGIMEDGTDETKFLLADFTNKFRWIDMYLLIRQAPPMSIPQSRSFRH